MLWRKLTAFFENSIHIVFFIIALVSSFFTVIHFPQYELHFQHSIPETILSAFIAALIFFLWDYLLKNKTKRATVVIYLITCGLLLSLQIFLFLKVATPIGWDVMEVLNSAEFGMYNGDYFAKYPNNLTLRLFLSLYLKATSFIPFLSSLRKFILLNLFFVDASILMAVLCAKKIYGQRAANRLFICAVLLIAFHPTLSVVYSDTLAMPFPIGTLCFFLYGLSAKTKGKKALFFSLSLVFAAIGYFIKPTALIMLIAVMIFALLRFRKSFLTKEFLVPLLIAFIVSSVTYCGLNAIKHTTLDALHQQYPTIKSRSALHYIALGLSTPDEGSSGYGSWNQKEIDWMQAHVDHENYTQEAIAHIGEKLKDFGFGGYLQHLANKLIWADSDGTFFYGNEGEFHAEAQAPQNTLRGKLQNAFYTETNIYQTLISSWWQGVWFFIWLRLTFAAFQKRSTAGGIAKLSLIGLFLFLLLFENRSRYLFLYLPVFLFAAEYTAKAKETTSDS